MVKATLETAHFTFEAFGETEEQAFAALKRGWQFHAAQSGADPNLADQERGDVTYMAFEIGNCFRDGEKLA